MVDEKPAEAGPVKKRSILGILAKVAIVLLIVVAGIIGMAAAQPNEFRIVRTATIGAPPAEVFQQVSDFHNWEHWSPWAKLDPNAKNTFEGPASGEGAIFSWDGNDKVGAGRMTVLESRPNELLKIKLEFTRPMEDTSTTIFDFKPEGDKTVVTWSMEGRHQNLIGKTICMLMNMDKVVGGQFETGLANLRTIVEKSPKS